MSAIAVLTYLADGIDTALEQQILDLPHTYLYQGSLILTCFTGEKFVTG